MPALNVEQVTVVDQRGKLLTQSGSQAVQTSQRQFTQAIEADYQQRIQTILAPLVGSSNVRAQVTAQLDFTTLEQTNEQYQPNSAPEKMAIRSRQSSRAEQGNGQPVGGVPGALSNQPPPVSLPINNPPAKESKSGDKKESSSTATVLPAQPYNNRHDDTTDVELDRSLTHTRSSAARIERLSAAVVVNFLPAKNGEAESVALSDAQVVQITALVKEAMGFSATRGDSVNIVNSPFSEQDDAPRMPLWQESALINLLISAGRYLLVALVAWLLWRKAVQPALQRHHDVQQQQRLALEQQARHEQEHAAQRRAERDEQQKSAQRVETEITAQELRDLAQQEPRVIALVIRQWMNKERTPS
ncbi:hypothetical protein E05_14030 [Plautia stali symbiont]|nr:hypothetical protein E05_14030 [Plautia stali symbiont]